MKKLFEAADACLADFRWQDAVLLKICLCSMGIMLGIFLPKKWRGVVLIAALLAFTATAAPLMVKIIPALREALCGQCGEA